MNADRRTEIVQWIRTGLGLKLSPEDITEIVQLLRLEVQKQSAAEASVVDGEEVAEGLLPSCYS